jgi:hypothetical protein
VPSSVAPLLVVVLVHLVKSTRTGTMALILGSLVNTYVAERDIDKVKRQGPDGLLDNEILVCETKLRKAKEARGKKSCWCCGGGGCSSETAREKKIEKLEARLEKLLKVKEDRSTFDVVVPKGASEGALLQVIDPLGVAFQAKVPAGLKEGDTFSLPYADAKAHGAPVEPLGDFGPFTK